MLSDTLGLDMAPKVPNKMYNRAAMIDDPVITLVASTDGSFSNNQAGILITRAKLNKTTPSKESHESPHQDNRPSNSIPFDMNKNEKMVDVTIRTRNSRICQTAFSCVKTNRSKIGVRNINI